MIEQIKNLLKDFSFEQVSPIGFTEPVSLSFYQNWLDQGLNASMGYLKDHLPQKSNLNQILPDARSSIVITHNYFQHPHPVTSMDEITSGLQVAKYAQGEDYHFWFKKQLEKAAGILKEQFPEHHFLVATDSQPVLERDFAYQAGLGWFGKNTCVIHSKKGSFFLIGEIISTLPLEPTLKPEVHPDRCGTCTRCIDACPTQALSETQLDARKCISYWTIESKTTPPLDLASKFQSWFFGCDVCQTVCPWNQKAFQYKAVLPSPALDRTASLRHILEILKSSNKSLEKRFWGTPLTRARGFGLKRNALVVAMNLNAAELIPELETLDLGERLEPFKQQILQKIKDSLEPTPK